MANPLPTVDPEAISIQLALRRAGIDADLPLTFGLGGGIGMMLFVFHYQGIDPTVGLITRYHTKSGGYTGFADTALQHSGATVDNHFTSSAAKAERVLLNALDGGQAVLCWLERSALPSVYNPGLYSQLSPWIVVISSRVGENFLVEDPLLGRLVISGEALRTARAAFKPTKNRLATFRQTDDAEPINRRIGSALNLTVTNMLTPEMSNFGLPALRNWSRLLTDGKSGRGWPNLFAGGRAHSDAMAATYLAIRIGGDANRRIYADFVDQAAAILGLPALSAAANSFRESSMLWRQLAEMALPDEVQVLAEIKSAINQRFELESAIRAGSDGLDLLQTSKETFDRLLERAPEIPNPTARFSRMAELIHQIEEHEGSGIRGIRDGIESAGFAVN